MSNEIASLAAALAMLKKVKKPVIETWGRRAKKYRENHIPLERALEDMEYLKRQMIAEIPESSHRDTQIIADWMDQGKHHIKAIYALGMHVGLGFAYAPQFLESERYNYLFQGVHRHVDMGKKIVHSYDLSYSPQKPARE